MKISEENQGRKSRNENQGRKLGTQNQERKSRENKVGTEKYEEKVAKKKQALTEKMRKCVMWNPYGARKKWELCAEGLRRNGRLRADAARSTRGLGNV